MPSVPSAGLLAFARAGAGVRVFLPGAGGRPPVGRSPGEIRRVPSWEWRPPAVGPGRRPADPAAAAELSIEERLRRPPRGPKPTAEQLLEAARSGFAADFGVALDPPFLSLGGVKQHHHRLLYVWAREVDAAVAATIAHHVSGPRAAVFVDLAEARRIVVPPHRRFIDQLAALELGTSAAGT